MNKVNEILTEWTYQLESGYPKKDEDYIVLQNILQESTDFDQSKIHRIVDRARGLQEDEAPDIPVDTGEIDNEDLETLKDAIRSVSKKYARYLKILSLFDPNALGTLSEILLAKLLDGEHNITL